ncbi:DNA translocase FtsK 4TM domain-containing protein [Candidatus Peregrinibacteria bacterium]|nr:MAG: DNA translocase FtsK 4TM domain-containing protein [Candidatus Peregrinibacteria bacterium]
MPLKRPTARRSKQDFKLEIAPHVAREVGVVIYACLAIFIYLIPRGQLGIVGDLLNNYLAYFFGSAAHLALPGLLLIMAAALMLSSRIRFDATRFFGIALIVGAGLGLIHMQVPMELAGDDVEAYGGLIGFLASYVPRYLLSDVGAHIVLSATLLIGVLIAFEISMRRVLQWMIPQAPTIKITTAESGKAERSKKEDSMNELNIVKPILNQNESTEKSMAPSGKSSGEPVVTKKPIELNIQKPDLIQKSEPTKERKEVDYSDWEFPSLDLLSDATSQVYVSDKVLKANAEVIRDKLGQFSIPVTMRDVNIGPSVMQYTLQPHEGVKLNKITALKNDVALALAAKSVRIEAPIPGKSLVGIEVPNDKRMVVHLREMLESDEFNSVGSDLTLTIGRDVAGNPVVDDLGAMPHLLIAGATGSGKSVGMNTFLLSLLYQNSPKDLKFIMVDPKRVELTPYNGIPHLLTPVITQPDKAHTALKWAVAEMNRRYQLLAEKGYRNIAEHNEAEEKTMPKIVIVIDELADLMMQSTKKETEAAICRIAQMARAVGMHLILATQRPSVNVITGVIKANIPARIAFTVTTGIDSRTIIDSIGAEDLLGMGDMLYLPGNMSRPIRVQGVYVSSKEIERVTNKLKLTTEPTYDETILAGKSSSGVDTDMVGTADGTDQDNLYNEAVEVIRQTGKASASLLQRRLSVGYARAARILDILEENGVIGPTNGAKPRQIFIDKN